MRLALQVRLSITCRLQDIIPAIGKADNRIGIGYTGSSQGKDLYKDVPFTDCTAKDETELKGQAAVDALNAAIATWNKTHNNRCAYLFEVDANGGYPVLVVQD